jgi:signal transduction histidine kinase
MVAINPMHALFAGTREQLTVQAAPAEAVAAAVRMAQPQAQTAEVKIALNVLGDCPDVMSDAGALRQMVLNLLVNAVKVSPQAASVEVTVGATKSGRVMIEIADRGPGLSAEALAASFKPFAGGRGGAGDRESTGLGLPIVRRLAELIGVRFALESRADEDCTRARIIFPETAVVHRSHDA